ncbi:MAG: histidine phosphatase family protein [Clostridia bacterium]|nr:histidine phosphatase family protein [Clostridia bacterium]
MRLLFIRHGDPNYEIDGLTPKGEREAQLLSARIAPMEIKAYYVSPLGRAQRTAAYTLQAAGRTATVCDWLQEFHAFRVTDDGEQRWMWDRLPTDWTQYPESFDKDRWLELPDIRRGNAAEKQREVTDGLDAVLAAHGYERDGLLYRAVQPNGDTLAFFCHFGVTCVMVGHLLGISPMVLWHGTMAAPTSVTELWTEERRPGIASFRMSKYGDLAHLSVAGEPPAFAGRFCEQYTNADQRHD